MSTSTSCTASFHGLLDVVREEFGRVAYSHKTHQKMLDRLNGRIRREKLANAFLITVTAGGTIDVLVTDGRAAKVVALVFSALALLLTVYSLSRGRERLVEQHRLAAQSLWLLREEYIHLICDLKGGALSISEARARRDVLTKSAARIYASAPDTDAEAYAEAQKALQKNEELTFSQQELDLMLPHALRSNSVDSSPPTA